MRTVMYAFVSVVTVFLCSTASMAIDADKIIVALPFDDGKGDTAEDIGPNGLEAIMDRTEWDKGKFGGAALLPGNASVAITNDPKLSLADTDFTLALWTNYAVEPPAGARGSQGFTLIGHDEGGGGTNKFIWWYSGAGIDFHVNKPGGAGVDWIDSDPWFPELDTWYHWALVREDDHYNYYLDGDPFGDMGAATSLPEEINHPMNIGWSEGPFFFEGLLDEAFVSGEALGEDDIGKLVAQGIAGALAVEPEGKVSTVWGALKAAQ